MEPLSPIAALCRGLERRTLRSQEDVIEKLGRNDPCHCGSGKKYKKCHLNEDSAARSAELADEQAKAAAATKAAAEAEEAEGEETEGDEKAGTKKAGTKAKAVKAARKPAKAPPAPRKQRRRGVA